MRTLNNQIHLRISVEADGVYVSHCDKYVGPFQTVSDIDPVNVGQELQVEPKRVLELQLSTSNRVYGFPITKINYSQLDSIMTLKSDYGSQEFSVKAAIGPEISPCGFIIFEGDEWISAETTYLYGELSTETDNKTKKNECLQPIILYNQKGQRNWKLLNNSTFRIGDKTLRPKKDVLANIGFNTLMSLNAVQRFLKGEIVNPEEWHSEICYGLKRYCNLNFDRRLYDVISCLIMASFFYDLFGVFPITTIFGPFESGKGRLLLCITYMGHRGLSEVDPSSASIYRSTEAWKPFIGIDEFNRISSKIETLLRSGYKKGSKVPRMEKNGKGTFILTFFETFSKIVIAVNILPQPNIIQKGITISMRKMLDPNPEKRDPVPEDFEEIRTKGYIARLTWTPHVKEYAERLNLQDIGLSGRGLEVWKPILTIASMLGGETWNDVLNYAKESRTSIAAESYEELKQVLDAIYKMIEEKKGIFLISFTPKQIHDLIWIKQKDEYKITKERQEIQGETSSEKYEYDTRSFEKIYNTRRIGRTYLSQLCIPKESHTEKGTLYRLSSSDEFDSLVERFYPELKHDRQNYKDLIPPQKILSDMSETSDLKDSNIISLPQETDKFSKQDTNNGEHDISGLLPQTQLLKLPDKTQKSHQENIITNSHSNMGIADKTDKSDISIKDLENPHSKQEANDKFPTMLKTEPKPTGTPSPPPKLSE